MSADHPQRAAPRPSTTQRIGWRLATAFSVVLVTLMALTTLAATRFAELSNTLQTITQVQLKNLIHVANVGQEANNAARELLVLLGAVRSRREAAYGEIDAARRRLDDSMAALALRLDSGPGAHSLAQLAQRLQVYRSAYGDTVDLVEAGDWDGARRTLGDQTANSLSLLNGAVVAMEQIVQAEAQQVTARLNAQIDQDRWLLIMLCGATMMVCGMMAFRVTRSIVRPLASAQRLAGRFAAGDYAERLQLESEDEVAQVSHALNQLADAAAERESRLMRLASTDTLTGLSQRQHLIAIGDVYLRALADAGGHAALICFDIDRLKAINAALGFAAGDAVIAEAARRTLALVHGDTQRAGRLAGGTLAVLMPLQSEAALAALAAGLPARVDGPLTWQGHALDLSLAAGIALFPGHATATEALLRHAEQAMFEAKAQRLRVAVYSPSQASNTASQLSLLSDLQTAISGGQLRQFLQPKVSPVDGRLCGLEALVRWQHPTRGWMPPAEFIPFAESTGRVREVTQWMLEQAVNTLAGWQHAGIALPIAVNVSTLDLQDAAFPERIERLLTRARVPAARLHLELTETGLLGSGPEPIRVLTQLRAIGVHLAIDDFGTGQSSLAYLQQLPVQELKIDRSFVTGVDADPRRREMLLAIVRLGHSLGLSVTAEGVETAGEMAVLGQVGCDLVQGYLVARPMDFAALQAWRAQRATVTPSSSADRPATPLPSQPERLSRPSAKV